MEPDSRSEESRERAVSSEPSSTRPNPFVDGDNSARKRRRTSLAGSSSGSIETLPPQPNLGAEASAVNRSNMKIDTPEQAPPSTPPPHSDSLTDSSPTGPHSSKVTLNLRNTNNAEEIPPPQSPSKERSRTEHVKVSVEESEIEMEQAPPILDDGASSPSVATSSDVAVEVIEEEEDEDDDEDDVELIGVQSTSIMNINSILLKFPYITSDLSLCETVGRLTTFFTQVALYDDVLFQLHAWFEDYLHYATVDLRAAEDAVRSAVDIRLLWQSLPELFTVIYSRRAILVKSPSTLELTTRLFATLPKLAAHLVRLDFCTLTNYTALEGPDDFDLVSPGLLQALASIISLQNEEQSQNGYLEVITSNAEMLDTFQKESCRDNVYQFRDGSMIKLVRLAEAVSARAARYPRKSMEFLTRICSLGESIVRDSDNLSRLSSPASGKTVRARQNTALAIRMFQTASTTLRQVVDKSVNHLSPDLVPPIMLHLSSMLQLGLQGSSKDAAQVLANHRKKYPLLPESFVGDAVVNEWRFDQLSKMITSRQMQLRVISLSSLAGHLVSEWRRCQDQRFDSQGEYLAHLSRRLTGTGLVDYLLGPTCHPEIIVEGYNVIGFLAVTETYKPEQTDLFWQTMTTTQDPRISEALVRMMAKTASHFDREPLAYLVEKMQSLPVEAFTSHMRELCESIIKAITQKQLDLVSSAAKLCLRLVQESSITCARGYAEYPDTLDFAATKLYELLQISANPMLRLELLHECLSDLSLRDRRTAGSLHVLYRLVRPSLNRELSALVKERELPRLLAEELDATTEYARTHGFVQVYATSLGSARRALIEHVIAEHGALIEPEHVAKFWYLLVGEGAVSQEDRAMGWQSLNNTLKTSHLDNPFLSLCLRQHLPSLSPDLYCPGTLLFVREALAPLANDAMDTALDGEGTTEDSSLELLWQIILTARPNTIETQAISILVNDIYVKGRSINSFPLDRARKVHLALVNRCFQQMADAAKELLVAPATSQESDGDMVISDEVDSVVRDQHEVRFTRSLLVLREFVGVLQSGSHHFATPDLRSLMLQSPSMVEGEPAKLKVQSFDGDQQTDVKPLNIGRQNTAASLLASIREVTGFSNYRIFYRGAPLTPTEDQICKSLEELRIHDGLILVKKESDAVSTPVNIKPGASPLEIEILGHFNALWDYLSMEEKLAKEIYYFLVKLPADGSILAAFESQDTSYLDVFPLGEPFKCLYTIHAVREYLNTRRLRSQAVQISPHTTADGQEVVPGQEEALLKALSLLIAAIEDPEVIGRCPTVSLQTELGFHLVETFVQLLKDSMDATRIARFLTPELQGRLMTLLSEATSAQESQYSVDIMSRALEALLECSSKSNDFWALFKQKPDTQNILQDLLFNDARSFVRKNTGKLIKDKCIYIHGDLSVTPLQFAETFWPIIYELLPRASLEPSRCEEVFTLAYLLLPKLAEVKSPVLDLQTCVRQCGELLVSHTCTEDVSHPDRIDIVSRGLVSILHYGVKYSVADRNAQFPPSFIRRLFHKHLFPREDPEGPLIPRVILNRETRLMLLGTIAFLTKDSSEQHLALLQALNSLVPYHDTGLDHNPYKYDLPQLFERSKAVRAPGGHAGLRNLSNTCYLNSLFTQLFMNPHFREFMLRVQVLDPDSHHLLVETQSLFSELQDSIRRSVDPSACVGQIMTYEESPIDIHTQMDVDEFYNLLFDRWESQMPNSLAKQKFRSIYGGQLVQQVKSKECEHISERIEPFSAIQCDIKGIASLQDSLQAYVDGEIMEGDNKYKCEKCNRHVDAVKRACLKEIPDNVIFHLKRFSFDLRTLQRNKINDHFAFPKELDLNPFTVEHLSNPQEEDQHDMFELVGVLVHSGTAESGHYYSYIRERPSSGDDQSWFEFNDDTVTPWDPLNLEGSCFGGRDPTARFDGGLAFEKVYSAYMLFYQRSSSVKKDQDMLRNAGLDGPIRIDLKPDLEMAIKEDNWSIVHRYCTNDVAHITFAMSILARTWDAPCSDDHKVENLAMHVALGHLDQIASRAKDIPDFQQLYTMISQACLRCIYCSHCLFEYFRMRPEAFRMLLLKNADANVRHAIGSLFITVLRALKDRLPDDYEPPDDDPENQALDIYDSRPSFITAAVALFNTLWDSFHTSLRAWPEFFHTMTSFAAMGRLEASTLLEENYLLKLFMIITADTADQELPTQYVRLAATLFRRQRPPNYEAIISLIDVLMDHLEPEVASQEFVEHPHGRLQLALENQPLPYTNDEVNEMHREWPRTSISIFVDKLIQHSQNIKSTESILRRLVEFSPLMDKKVFITLRLGIADGQQNAPPVAAYLRGALSYVRWSSDAINVSQLIQHICDQCRISNVEGMAYISFFERIFDAPRRTDDQSVSVCLKSLRDIPKWAPALIGYMDQNVRCQTDILLEEMVWQYGENPGGFEEDEGGEQRAQELVVTAKKLAIACLQYIHSVYVVRNAQAPKDSAQNLQEAIQRCADYFNDDNADIRPELDRQFMDLKPVLKELDRLMVDEIEEEASDWDNSVGSSEPEPMMDVADLQSAIALSNNVN